VLSHLSADVEDYLIQRALADALGWDPGHTSRIVSKLAERGLVRREQQHGRYEVALSNAEPSIRFADLVREFPHVDFSALLSGSTIKLLFHLDEERTAAALAERAGVSRATVYRRLNQLQNVGMVTKRDARFAVTSQFEEVVAFALSLVSHLHRQEAAEHTSGVRLIWTDVDEYLIRCQTSISLASFHETGPKALDQYGIPLLTRDEHYYFRSQDRSSLTPADLVCQLLLIDDGARYRSYCLLLITAQEIDGETLTQTAERYDRVADIDLQNITQELCTYLESNGAESSEKLPDWNEFKSTAADYDISV